MRTHAPRRRTLAGIVGGLLLAVSGAALARAVASPEASFPVKRLAAVARRMAISLGDPNVRTAFVVATTRQAALDVVSIGSNPASDATTRTSPASYLIVIRGHFTCYGCSTPGGVPLPRGTVATLVWSSRRGGTDFGLGDQFPKHLSRLGHVVTIRIGGSSAIALARAATPQAFLRPRRQTDTLPRAFRRFVASRRPTDSRRIASSTDRSGRTASLYLVKVAGKVGGPAMCLELITRSAAGGTCFAESVARSLAADGKVVAVEGRLFAGVAANNVARVVVLGAQGNRTGVYLSADKGFIYQCPGSRGCVATHGVRAVDAYGRKGTLLSMTSWH